MNSLAAYSDRRQIIVFTVPTSESGKLVQDAIDELRCQLADRHTDVRIVDINELPDAGATSSKGQRAEQGVLEELALLRGEGRPEFEVVLIGKDGGVKARTTDAGALQDFLALIDTMPMRRAEMRSRSGSEDSSPCGIMD